MATVAEQQAEDTQKLRDASVGLNDALATPDIQATSVQEVEVTPDSLLSTNGLVAEQAGDVPAATGQATVVEANVGTVAGATPIDAVTSGTVDTIQAAEGVAATADLKQGELVSEQLAELTIGLESGEVPIWAQSAVRAVDRQLASRGLSRSSIGQAELTNAILQSALPIAQANAQALQQRSTINLANKQQIAVQNLNNDQQATLQTAINQQQALLSDQAAQNAAIQFNATSDQQTQQFNAQMKSSIEQNNAQRITAMEEFNSGQVNAIGQFNAQMDAQVEQFNIANATAIAQSNINWRRQANTANTAAVNAANMADASQRFQLTSQEMANRWQAVNDLASWANQSTENERTRAGNLAVAAINKEAMTDAATQEAYGTIIGYSLQGAKGEGGIINDMLGSLSGGEGGGGTGLLGLVASGADKLFDTGADDEGFFNIGGIFDSISNLDFWPFN